MILLMNEEATYRYWVAHHRDGYVLDGRHRPRWTQLMLHRATCPQINHATHKRTHWTTGSRFKACSLDRQEMIDWVVTELDRPYRLCPDCAPGTEFAVSEKEPRRLSPLAARIVDYVLEVATIHLDVEEAPYQLTVESIAESMGKSPAQVAPILKKLLDDGYLARDEHLAETTMRPRQIIYPTPDTLRMLPYFLERTEEEVRAELGKLRVR